MFSSDNPQEWFQLARALGLVPYQHSESYCFGSSFRQLKRSLAPLTSSDPSFNHWLFGAYQGVEAIVLTFDTGSGSSTSPWTGAIARIDPPLFLGLSVESQGFFHNLFGSDDILLGYPAFDGKLRILGPDPLRIARLLSPADAQGQQMLSYIVWLMEKHDVRISDSSVAIACSGTATEPKRIAGMLESAIWLANLLRARKAAMADTSGEAYQRQQWDQFSRSNQLSFDPLRMKISGNRGDAGIEVALDTDGQQFCTAVTGIFPQPPGVVFSVVRSHMPSFLQGILSRDIEVGDLDFDKMYKVTGYPVDRVQRTLAKPGIITILKQLGFRAPGLQLNERQLFLRLPGASPSANELQQIVDMTFQVSRDLVTQTPVVGPYR